MYAQIFTIALIRELITILKGACMTCGDMPYWCLAPCCSRRYVTFKEFCQHRETFITAEYASSLIVPNRQDQRCIRCTGELPYATKTDSLFAEATMIQQKLNRGTNAESVSECALQAART